jgi:GAF domain-containing protein
MPRAPTPIDEAARIKALHKHPIFNQNPSDRLDQITRTVSQQLDVPIAVISLVDSEIQMFKSVLGVPYRQTLREHAICGYVILQDEPLVIEDTERDDRTLDNPFVTSNPNIRFYAGAPLVSPCGLRIGALCGIDRRPRKISDRQRAMLVGLARRVMGLYEVSLLAAGVNRWSRSGSGVSLAAT